MNRINTRAAFQLIAIVIASAFAATGAQAQSSDDVFTRRLVGTWTGPGIEKTFNRDGTITGFLYSPSDPEHTRVAFKTVWKVENGFLIGEVVASQDSLLTGQKYKDKIISVNDKEYIFENEGGQREIRTRKETEVASPSPKSEE